MNPYTVIPDPDVLPLPGPVWLFKLLLHLTFTLHLLAMNFVLGGAVIAAVERVRGRASSLQTARWVERRLPPIMAVAVTMGVAPLLFVQALYGHLLYTSSVIMAWPWLLVVPVLIVSYYLAYILSFRGEGQTGGIRLASWVLLLGLVAIAFVYVNNMSLALRPESWAVKYAEDAGGTQLNLGDATLLPRFLHMLVAAVAVAGLLLAWVGARRIQSGRGDGGSMYRVGAAWFLVPTATQFLFGLWFLIVLPRDVMLGLMGENVLGTVLLVLAILLPLGMLIHQAMAFRSTRPLAATRITAGLLFLTVVSMVLLRDSVRDAMLRPSFELSTLQTQPQIGVFALFAVVLVIGLALTAWMIRAFLTSTEG